MPERKPSPAVAESTEAVDVARDYRRLEAMTREPVFVDPRLAALCRGISPAEIEEAQRHTGPHALSAVKIYMNDAAATAFRKGSTPYPVGSIVVKEKQAAALTAGVGGMIKRPQGYDPAHGDWEYFYFENPAKIESGPIPSCVQCHAGAAARDYVFGGWAHSAR